jgi:AcrR family transcriptional regulator
LWYNTLEATDGRLERKKKIMPKGIPLSTEERNQRRLEIAHAAEDLIFEKSFIATSVSQIAKAAGIGKSTFYDFFTNKDELILLLLEEPLSEITRRATDIAEREGSVAERIKQILTMHLEILLQDRALIFKLSYEFIRLPEDVRAVHQQKQKAYRMVLVNLIKEGIAAGSLRPVNPVVAMETLLSVLQSVMTASHVFASPQEFLDQSLDLVMKGLLMNEGKIEQEGSN